MKAVFYIVAIVMVLIALAVVVLPLLHRGRQLGRPRGIFALALTIVVALPLLALGLYQMIGTPAALNGVAQQQPMNINQAVAELRAHLAQQPGDLQGWLLLAQTTTAMHQPEQARDAYEHALKIDAGNTDAMVGWAESDTVLQPDHVIGPHARDLLQQAVSKQADNQRGLWLLGISQFQQSHFTDAAASWRRLQPMLEPGSSVANTVAQQIAAANARTGGAPAVASAATTGPALQVQVSLAPALQAQLKSGDTLFVYARAPDGPPMPLAVARMDASALPASVTLTDAMAMTPQLKLSSVPRVLLGARISHSGQAIAQAGDLEGNAGVIEVGRTDPIHIVIDKVH